MQENCAKNLDCVIPALGRTFFLDTDFRSHTAAQYNCRQVPAIVSHTLAQPFTRLMQENCVKNLIV